MYGNQVFDDPAGCKFPVIFSFCCLDRGLAFLLGWRAYFAFALGFDGIELNWIKNMLRSSSIRAAKHFCAQLLRFSCFATSGACLICHTHSYNTYIHTMGLVYHLYIHVQMPSSWCLYLFYQLFSCRNRHKPNQSNVHRHDKTLASLTMRSNISHMQKCLLKTCTSSSRSHVQTRHRRNVPLDHLLRLLHLLI